MEDKIYCYEKYKGYTIVVEYLPYSDIWEGIAYKEDYRNPSVDTDGADPVCVREDVLRLVDKILEENSYE